jgi:hypothetical protein
LTDLVGPFYTVVFEISFNSLADFESGKPLSGRETSKEPLA